MADCRYCDETFEDEDALLSHLASDHDAGELSRIDRRRIAGSSGDDTGGLPVKSLAAVGIAAVVMLALLGAIVILGNNGVGGPALAVEDTAITPTNYNAIHEHGLFDVTIEEESLDFANDPALISADSWFHFHGGNNVWHVHGEDVSLEYALATLGIEVEEGGSVLEYDGEVYDDSEAGTTVSITVDGEPVDPTQHVLEGVDGTSPEDAAAGEHVEIVVETTD